MSHDVPGIGEMAYDAILRNLAVIGEAARALPDEEKARMPAVPWDAISGLRNVVIHEYFRVDPAIVADIVDDQLAALARIIQERDD